MKRTIITVISVLTLCLSFASCTNEEGDKAGKPGFMQKNDSISKQPAFGDTANTGS
jgi:hypothetical protein